MQSIIKKRDLCVKQIIYEEQLLSSFEESAEWPDAELYERIRDLEELKAKFTETQQNVEEHVEDSDSEMAVRGTFRSIYSKVRAFYSTKLSKTPSHISDLDATVKEQSNASETELSNAVKRLLETQQTVMKQLQSQTTSLSFLPGAQSSSSSFPSFDPRLAYGSAVKLPETKVKTFSGDYAEWPEFEDLFSVIIDQNTRLQPAQKLQYLKTYLDGEASILLKNVPTTADNYASSWKLLKDTYDHPKYRLETHLNRIWKQDANISTAANLRQFIMTVTEADQALRKLTDDQRYDFIMNYFIITKLDTTTKQLWARDTKVNKTPTFTEMLQFLNQRRLELDIISQSGSDRKGTKPVARQQGVNIHNVTTSGSCICCKQNHQLYACPQFKGQSVQQRWETVKQNNVCFNCLSKTHKLQQCPSSQGCRICQQRHNTMLHSDSHSLSTNNRNNSFNNRINTQGRSGQHNHIVATPSTSSVSTQPIETSALPAPSAVATSHNHSAYSSQTSSNSSKTVLPTAIIHVEDSSGKWQLCRALLDSAAQSSLITEDCIQRLGLKRSKSTTILKGISGSHADVPRGEVCLKIKPVHQQLNIVYTWASILNKVTCELPRHQIESENVHPFQNIILADPTFSCPGQIDVLIGCDLFFQVLRDGRFTSANGLTAQNTMFGYIIGGSPSDARSNLEFFNYHSIIEIDDNLKRFWEIEEVDVKVPFTDEQQKCEEHFVKTHTRNNEGRYITRLPFKKTPVQLGQSRDHAVQRLLSMERRFAKNPNLQQQYTAFMSEYEDLGHMQLISKEEKRFDSSSSFYLPHHAVMKESSTTTKLRVVFDASKVSSNGTSLNNHLLVGPTIQNDLYTLLFCFRLNHIAFSADIAKMYRQVKVTEEDANYQRIVWRNNPNEPIRDYKLTTVTYGTASAPFTAIRAVQQLAIDEGHKYPAVKDKIIDNFYVDDYLGGSHDVQSAIEQQKQLTSILHSGGFQLRKWASNSEEFMSQIPEADREYNVPFEVNKSESIKSLGVHWNPQIDCFIFKTNWEFHQQATKRSILSNVARIFDPLGWLAPFIIQAKILLQLLWIKGLNWDDEIPENLSKIWTSFKSDLHHIQNIQIERWLPHNQQTIQLHGFCDASEKAYAAVVYWRTTTADGECHVRMISAKTKVAPIKTISLPRLELCGAVLLTRLMSKIKSALKDIPTEIYAWTDSTIVLDWLADHPRRWKTYIANRTTTILEVIPYKSWSHVKTDENPADAASRGISLPELINQKLWWDGPSWLKNHTIQLTKILEMGPEALSEEKSHIHINVNAACISTPEIDLTLKYSSLRTLKRVVAWCFRFVQNSKSLKKDRVTGPLSVEELDRALYRLINIQQLICFKEDIKPLLKYKELPYRSKLTSLRPFLDKQDVLRVEGRLESANISYNMKYPVILSSDHHLTTVLVRDYHIRNLHAGPQLLSSILNQTYHIIGGRRLIRKVVHDCVTCKRQKGSTAQQLQGNLPPSRVQPGRAFLTCGVDYAGPFITKAYSGKCKKTQKSYIAVFVCFATRAVHLEVVSDLSTAAFLAAFKRFTSRRGLCKDIHSDNGGNFLGANRELYELNEFVKQEQFNKEISSSLSLSHINWHFNPPLAPHMGGLWEAAVKSMKYHLYRVMKDSRLTFEELSTVACQIEAMLNSRPICTKGNDNEAPNALTPGHFLVGEPLNAIPEPSLEHLKLNHLSRWQLLSRYQQDIWKRWSTEYLTNLRKREKWTKTSVNVKLNDIVLLKEDNIPPTNWHMGRIIDVHPGKDEKVRVVTVKTANGVFQRPIIKLCPFITD